ncbi:MAG TPA: glycogen debranching protein GlgX [Burkholderiales bacterium]|nr:glycogen debranching protein GlgX [Burkholderiales bacterium]
MEAPARALVAPSAAWRGRPSPLGATWDGEGVNFALYSEHAERVELCLFDPKGRREIERVELRNRTGFVWHCYLPEARPGLLYGYRVHGPQLPELGHRFNPHRVLLDPYARLVSGNLSAGAGRSRVVDPAFSWGEDRPPRTPWQDTVIYELHVKGFTQRHPGVPEQLRGTYAGLASPAAVEHLRRLGVTAVELLPVHAFVDERRLLQQGLRQYWGYASIGYFAPEMRYCATGGAGEFKTMVKTLHSAGIEVILDVVYNHSGEGDHHGPTLSFRGIDNRTYYRLDPHNPRHYADTTGTGNSLNLAHPAVLRLVMDSLRYWVEEMHVDGFRFDLATTLVRDNASFLSAMFQDPVLAQVKLIAEPWDLAPDGYRLGRFPPPWSEWNDKYRDCVRAYWRGDEGRLGELAARLSGSSDLFEATGRGPAASINFVTAHDGFTLEDLVSYNEKHNEANHEGNRDGAHDNKSWNFGVEGPTDNEEIRSLRDRQKRNLLATLVFSHGVPMLLAGDEMGRTQRGNNNAYCQDSELSWIDWDLGVTEENLLQFTMRLLELRRAHPAFRRLRYSRNIEWLSPRGEPMSEAEWNLPHARVLGALLSGRKLPERGAKGDPVVDDDLLLLLNAHHDPVGFALPGGEGAAWSVLLDTSLAPVQHPVRAGTSCALQGRALVLLSRPSV